MSKSWWKRLSKKQPQEFWTQLIGFLVIASLLLFAYYAFHLSSDLPHATLRVENSLNPEVEESKVEALNAQALPATFDSRSVWPKCNLPVWTAGDDCPGGTWAIAAADVLAHQLCVLVGQLAILSPQAILNCVKSPAGDGCSSGNPVDAWSYTSLYGLPSSSCLPYTGRIAACSSSCPSASTSTTALSSTSKPLAGVTAIQMAIQRKGAVQVTFEEYMDFVMYSGGIYEHKSGLSLGPVSVKLVGWGLQGGVKYWIGVAAKGVSWGMGGYFYMKMGQLGVENNAIG